MEKDLPMKSASQPSCKGVPYPTPSLSWAMHRKLCCLEGLPGNESLFVLPHNRIDLLIAILALWNKPMAAYSNIQTPWALFSDSQAGYPSSAPRLQYRCAAQCWHFDRLEDDSLQMSGDWIYIVIFCIVVIILLVLMKSGCALCCLGWPFASQKWSTRANAGNYYQLWRDVEGFFLSKEDGDGSILDPNRTQFTNGSALPISP